MGIKKDKILRLGQRVLPLKVKKLLVKHNVVKGAKDTKALVYNDYDVMEFWLQGFHDDGLEKSFKHIMKLYDMCLKDDLNWHYIYEGHYALIRCSYKYVSALVEYFNKHEIEYKPPVWWREGTHVTALYKEIFTEIFHWTSVLAIQMAKNEEADFYISQSADRIVHIFLLQSIYLAEINGDLERLKSAGYGIQYWEAQHMSNLANFRAYNIGKIDGNNQLKAHWDKIREKEEESDEC